jgi:hypothetical protein
MNTDTLHLSSQVTAVPYTSKILEAIPVADNLRIELFKPSELSDHGFDEVNADTRLHERLAIDCMIKFGFVGLGMSKPLCLFVAFKYQHSRLEWSYIDRDKALEFAKNAFVRLVSKEMPMPIEIVDVELYPTSPLHPDYKHDLP